MNTETTPTGAAARTPQDSALEHAEYMAQGGEALLAALESLSAAELRLDESDDIQDPGYVADARDLVWEGVRSLRSDIYEFRKRRDRAAAIPLDSVKAEPTDYPPLPANTAHIHSDADICVDRMPTGPQIWPICLYTDDQMKEYVDADRASRAAPVVQAAPVPEGMVLVDEKQQREFRDLANALRDEYGEPYEYRGFKLHQYTKHPYIGRVGALLRKFGNGAVFSAGAGVAQPEACAHAWDGPEWRSVDGRTGSVTCSKCGCLAIDHSMRTA